METLSFGQKYRQKMYIGNIIWINGDASFRWSIGPHSAFIEPTTILTTHPSLLKIYELDWKHILHIGNITFVWKHTYIGKIKRHIIRRVARKE